MATKVKAKKSAKPVKRAVRSGRTSTSKLSSKNQLTLPVDIVRASGLETGAAVRFEIKDGLIVITPLIDEAHPLSTLIGAGGNLYDGFDLAKERSQMWPE
jgi:bifunctional DNA-binding transcriptional regulator/antitoxin component of YhaV-PrlF toxin-antitoxin module